MHQITAKSARSNWRQLVNIFSKGHLKLDLEKQTLANKLTPERLLVQGAVLPRIRKQHDSVIGSANKLPVELNKPHQFLLNRVHNVTMLPSAFGVRCT